MAIAKNKLGQNEAKPKLLFLVLATACYKARMTLALVSFRLKAPVSIEQARALFEATAGRYLGKPGLRRKSYFRADDGLTVGAIYDRESRSVGETLYDDAWRARVTAHYGAEPELTWLETPVVVDNEAGEIRKT